MPRGGCATQVEFLIKLIKKINSHTGQDCSHLPPLDPMTGLQTNANMYTVTREKVMFISACKYTKNQATLISALKSKKTKTKRNKIIITKMNQNNINASFNAISRLSKITRVKMQFDMKSDMKRTL